MQLFTQKKGFVLILFFAVAACALIFTSVNAFAAAPVAVPVPSFNISVGQTDNPAQVASTLQLFFFITIIAVAPYILIMLTCFTRIIICLHFIRSALGTQQMPPSQVLIGLALFLTFFLMGNIITDINNNAIKPYAEGRLTQQQAIETGMKPVRAFMLRQVEDKDIALFAELAGQTYETEEDIPSRVLIPAFILGEMTKGFKFGFLIYLPFIVVDMVVASTLMAMGMMMLPPAMISLPFKILLFVMVDGWSLVIKTIITTFR